MRAKLVFTMFASTPRPRGLRLITVAGASDTIISDSKFYFFSLFILLASLFSSFSLSVPALFLLLWRKMLDKTRTTGMNPIFKNKSRSMEFESNEATIKITLHNILPVPEGAVAENL